MRRIIIFVLFFLTACTNSQISNDKIIREINFMLVPNNDDQALLAQMEPIKDLIIQYMGEEGYTVDSVNLTLATSAGAAAEALAANTTHISLLNQFLLIQYENDGIIPILVSKRGSFSVQSENPLDWNTGEVITRSTTDLLDYSLAMIYSGPSDMGQYLYSKFINNEEITVNDYNNAIICHTAVSSAFGYIYPSLWFLNNYGLSLEEFDQTLMMFSFADVAASLANKTCDVGIAPVTLRLDYKDKWMTEWERDQSIWDEVKVLGIAPRIYNGALAVNENHPDMSEDLINALKNTFINIGNDPIGKNALSAYGISAYEVIPDHFLDDARIAANLIVGQ